MKIVKVAKGRKENLGQYVVTVVVSKAELDGLKPTEAESRILTDWVYVDKKVETGFDTYVTTAL